MRGCLQCRFNCRGLQLLGFCWRNSGQFFQHGSLFLRGEGGGWIRPAPDTAGCTWPLRHWRSGGQIITHTHTHTKKTTTIISEFLPDIDSHEWGSNSKWTEKGTSDTTFISKENLKHIITMEEATASYPQGETSSGRLRSYLHKQLDNWLVVRFYSVLRYRQRHSGCCY